MRLGLKLRSTDISLISDARKLWEKGIYGYIELYIIPNSYKETIKKWKPLNIKFVIHAPHSSHGINFAQADKWETNLQGFNEAQLFADELGSDFIIIHGGNNGSFDETVRQIQLLNEKRILLENKPKVGMLNEICVGWSPHEFQQAYDANVLYGTALDFGHAACAARASGVDAMELIKSFMKFNPKIFHLSDGDASSEKDRHLNLGNGDLDLAAFISFIPEGGLLSLETPRSPSRGLKDFIDDVNFLKGLYKDKGYYEGNT